MTDVVGVRILQLYPDELGVTGDAGNIAVLRTRLERSGVPTTVEFHRPGQQLECEPDLIVIGNGPFSALRRVHADAMVHASRLGDWSARVPFFAVGAGLELLSTRVEDPSGSLDGLGLLSAVAHRGRKRRVGYVIAQSTRRERELIAFEDQATELSDVSTPFATIVRDVTGNVSRPDGVQTDTVTGTLLQGPLLPLNPWLADDLARAAAQHAGLSYTPDASLAGFDRLADRATERMRANVSSVFTTIQ